jgi:hypothetical protein
MDEPKAYATALLEQAKAILLKPSLEWPAIAAAPISPSQAFVRYAMPLAAIGPVCQFLRGQLFGFGAFGFSYRPGLMSGLAAMVTSYVLSLVGLFVLALIADFLAPKFAGEANRSHAVKLVVYGATASFAAGIFSLIPGLGVLSLLGLYSFYLFYTGATPLMKVPQDKAIAYTAVTVVCAVVLSLVASAVTLPVVNLFGGGAALTDGSGSGEVSGKLALPGGGSLDLDQTRKAAEQMQNLDKKPAIAPAALQGLLPTSIGSYQRTAVEANGLGAMGSSADGTYMSGSNTFHLKVTDMAAIGALAGLGSALGVQQSKEDADGYEKTATVNGQLQTEAWHKSASNGKFGVVVANRFSIEAEGTAASIDELKAAVASIDASRLASLAS